MCADSVASLLRNLRRAGTELNRWVTVVRVPGARPASRTCTSLPPLITTSVPGPVAGRVCNSKCDTLAMDGTASPRKPKVPSRSKSAVSTSLLVACRSSESMRVVPGHAADRCPRRGCSCVRRGGTPPRCGWRRHRALFSTNSFTTAAGRSMTSPAAIWLATRSERMRMVGMGSGKQSRKRERAEARNQRLTPLPSFPRSRVSGLQPDRPA
jgi:hypothetical protein